MGRIIPQALCFLAQAYVSFATALRPTVNTTNGTLAGAYNVQYDQDFFLGVPFAQPPTGNLRFRRPQPLVKPWKLRDATETGAWCHSAPLSLPVFTQSEFSHQESEDCLTLNIVRPASIGNDSALPVLVSIPGGGFQEGSGSDQRYNMSFLVQDSVSVGAPIIGVAINYRLSGFGFLSGRTIKQAGASNLGLHDQRLALAWIQDNIAAFGGDPSRVTIQGESAGALSVGVHFLAFGGRDDNLFRAGIAQSGGPSSAGIISLDEQDILYANVLNQTGCITAEDSLVCLRNQSVETLKSAFQGVSHFPAVDGDLIAENPHLALEGGRFIRRPLLTGTNTNEGTSFVTGDRIIANSSTVLQATIAAYLGRGVANTTSGAVAAEYLERMSSKEAQASLGSVQQSSPELGSLYGRASLFVGDLTFIAPRRFSTKIWAKYGVPAYSYRFDTVPNGVSPRTLGASHYAEVPFAFRNFDGVGHDFNFLASNSKEERREFLKLSNRMSRMWLSFVNQLSPNAHYALDPKAPWPTYTNRSAVNMVFQKNKIRVEQDSWRTGAISQLFIASAEKEVS